MVEDSSGAKRSTAVPTAPDSAAKRQKVAAPAPGDYPQFQLQTTITGVPLPSLCQSNRQHLVQDYCSITVALHAEVTSRPCSVGFA